MEPAQKAAWLGMTGICVVWFVYWLKGFMS